MTIRGKARMALRVAAVRRMALRTSNYPHRAIVLSLTDDSDPALVAMWRELEMHSSGDESDLWVHGFIEAAAQAMRAPRFHDITAKERARLAVKIQHLTARLVNEIKSNDLDVSVVCLNGAMFRGLFIYEDFSDTVRAQIDEAVAEGKDHKVQLSDLIRFAVEGIPSAGGPALGEVIASDGALERLAREPAHGAKVKGAPAIRFQRRLASRNRLRYGEPLVAVIAAACNALHPDADYSPDLVAKNLRGEKQRPAKK